MRAGICEDPKDYRWSGYGEAVAGGREAREAIAWLDSFDSLGMARMPAGAVAGADGVGRPGASNKGRRVGAEPAREALTEPLRRWRCELFGVPANEARQQEQRALQQAGGQAGPFRERVSKEKALEVLAAGGRLSRGDYLRCRVRYFTDGAVLGGKEFVEGVFRSARDRFSAKRTSGARALRGLEVVPKPERLYNLRQLQRRVFG